jgi:hypothetical protein
MTLPAAPVAPAATDDLSPWRAVMSPTVVIAALGYFVDLYDLLLFRIVRQPSLVALGCRPTRR